MCLKEEFTSMMMINQNKNMSIRVCLHLITAPDPNRKKSNFEGSIEDMIFGARPVRRKATGETKPVVVNAAETKLPEAKPTSTTVITTVISTTNSNQNQPASNQAKPTITVTESKVI